MQSPVVVFFEDIRNFFWRPSVRAVVTTVAVRIASASTSLTTSGYCNRLAPAPMACATMCINCTRWESPAHADSRSSEIRWSRVEKKLIESHCHYCIASTVSLPLEQTKYTCRFSCGLLGLYVFFEAFIALNVLWIPTRLWFVHLERTSERVCDWIKRW